MSLDPNWQEIPEGIKSLCKGHLNSPAAWLRAQEDAQACELTENPP